MPPRRMALKKTVLSGPAEKSTRLNKEAQALVSFQSQLEETEAAHRQQRLAIQMKIGGLRKDNERILRHQERRFGATLDEVGEMKRDLETCLSSNTRLYREMEESRARFSRLAEMLDAVKEKVASAKTDIGDCKRKERAWLKTEHEYGKVDDRCRELATSNKAFRYLLLRNQINPNTRVDGSEGSAMSTQSEIVTTAKTRVPPWGHKNLTNFESMQYARHSDELESIRRGINIQHRNAIRRQAKAYDGYHERFKLQGRSNQVPT